VTLDLRLAREELNLGWRLARNAVRLCLNDSFFSLPILEYVRNALLSSSRGLTNGKVNVLLSNEGVANASAGSAGGVGGVDEDEKGAFRILVQFS
jgi:hypothetical protein